MTRIDGDWLEAFDEAMLSLIRYQTFGCGGIALNKTKAIHGRGGKMLAPAQRADAMHRFESAIKSV